MHGLANFKDPLHVSNKQVHHQEANPVHAAYSISYAEITWKQYKLSICTVSFKVYMIFVS